MIRKMNIPTIGIAITTYSNQIGSETKWELWNGFFTSPAVYYPLLETCLIWVDYPDYDLLSILEDSKVVVYLVESK